MAAGTQELSLRRTLAEMLRTGRAQYPILIVAALVVFIPLGLVDVLDENFQHALDELGDDISLGQVGAAGAAAFAHAVVAFTGEVLYTGAVAAAVIATRDGSEPSLLNVARRLAYGRLIAVDILQSVVVAIGFLLLIVPGLIALGRFALLAPAVEFEDCGVRAAFRRSAELVRGNTGKVLVLVVPVLVVSDGLATLVQAGVIGSIGDTFAGDWFAATAADMLTAPFFALAVIVLFLELRGSQPSGLRDSSLAR